MANSSSDSIKAEVIGGVITAGVLAIVGAVWAFAPGAWKWFTDLLASAWAHLTNPTSVPTWWLYMLYAVSAAAVLAVALRIRTAVANAEPTVADYREDRFFGAVWRWNYAHGAPTNAWAFCPTCDTMLVYSERYDHGQQYVELTCETCARRILTEPGDKDYLVSKVHRQIDRKVRNGEWKNYVERKAEGPT